jgi:hypothetical protein
VTRGYDGLLESAAGGDCTCAKDGDASSSPQADNRHVNVLFIVERLPAQDFRHVAGLLNRCELRARGDPAGILGAMSRVLVVEDDADIAELVRL